MIDPRDIPKLNAAPPATATDLVRILTGSRKTSSMSARTIVDSLVISGWMYHYHNTGDHELDTQTAKDAVLAECGRLAEELDRRLEQLGALENELLG